MSDVVTAAERAAADIATGALAGLSTKGVAGAEAGAAAAAVQDIPGMLAALDSRVAAIESAIAAKHPLVDKILSVLGRFFPHDL